ncbi:Fibronectin type III [Candidatus Nanopelagicaceae bacterium]
MAKGAGRIGLGLALVVGLLTSIALPAAHALSTVTTLPSGFTWAGSKSATLSPTTGWTVLSNISRDDISLNLALGFNVSFEGLNYNTIQIHSNTYIGFSNANVTSTANDTTNGSQYSSLAPNSPALPAIHMCSKDNSYQYVYYRVENGGTQVRIRYEGTASTSGTVGGSTIIYEALFTANSSVIDIGMGINAACDANSGLAGVTNGGDAVLEAQFPNITYNANGYSVATGTSFKNNDYRISAGPSVSTFTTSTPSPTNLTSLSYSLTFSESITGLAGGDFSNTGTASGCSFTPSASSGNSFAVIITNCSEGTLIPQLASGGITSSSSSATGPATATNGKVTVLDRSSPTISTVSTTNGNYSSAITPSLNFTVVFNESVTVTGTPQLPITIGSTSRYANFVALTDSKTATFRYSVTVDYNDIDLDGIAVLSPLETNTGTITDLATNVMTNFSFTPPVTTSVNVYQPPSAPTIDSITANNTSLTIYFTAGATNGSSVSNYKYSLNSGAFTALSPTDAVSPITITGLTNGTTYQIQIKAVSNLGDGLASNIVSSSPTASASVAISLTASATTANKGTPITITAQVNQAGVVTFFWNGERIPGCIKKVATSSATCLWKPNVTGQWSIQALLDPTDPTYVDSYSQKLPVFILRRVGNR